MATTTTGNGQIVAKGSAPGSAIQKRGEGGLVGLLQQMGPELAKALPRHLNPDRMLRIVTTAIKANPKLANCSPVSFFGCVLQAAQLGLEPNTPLGQIYLIPRENRRENTVDCTMIIGYQGLLDLLWRTGDVASIAARVIREGDDFEIEYGLDAKLSHRPSQDPDREERSIVGAYAIVSFKDGSKQWEYLSRAQIEARRKMSQGGGQSPSSPWVQHYEAMCIKTALRAMVKLAPRSTEKSRPLVEAVHLDERHESGSQAWREGLDDSTAGVMAALEKQAPAPQVVDEPKSAPDATREPGSDG